MAKKVKEAAKAAAKAAPAAKETKKVLTPEEKAAKKAARKEALKNRPAGQRPNSKQIDIIELENGGKVLNFAAPVRKHGSLVTSVALNANGEVVSTSVVMIEGVSAKSKKGHGYLVDKMPGAGKASKAEEAEDEDVDEADEDEAEEEDED